MRRSCCIDLDNMLDTARLMFEKK